jgi:hypothetical protein
MVGHGECLPRLEDPDAAERPEVMRRTLHLIAAALAAAAAASTALAAGQQAIPVSPASTTPGVATLELLDPAAWTGRSAPSENGVHFTLCNRAALRPCSLGRGAVAARRQAFELALGTLRERAADLVVVALPQSPTRHAQLVFERDILDTPLDPLAATAERIYALSGLIRFSDEDDSLVLVRLQPWPAAQPDR